MLRFGTVAGRGLWAQSSLLRSSPNYVQTAYNSSVASPASPSYDWIANTEFKFNKDRSEQEFQQVLTDIQQRLRRVEVPHAVRPYVFRPKNAQLLKSLHLHDKQGNPYQPEVWKGPPGRKQLMQLIRRVTNPETANIALEVLNSYITHYPSEVQSIHLSTLLRSSARAGSFYKALDLIQTPKFAKLIDDDVAKEVIRLYAIRAVTIDKESTYKDLSKVMQKFSKYTSGAIEQELDTHLLMVYGLAPFKDHSLVEPHVARVKQLLPLEAPLSADAKLSEHHGLQYTYMNLVLGRLGLKTLPAEVTAGVETAHLDALISGIEEVFAANKMKSPLERYVKHASLGIWSETEDARARLSSESEGEAKEESE